MNPTSHNHSKTRSQIGMKGHDHIDGPTSRCRKWSTLESCETPTWAEAIYVSLITHYSVCPYMNTSAKQNVKSTFTASQLRSPFTFIVWKTAALEITFAENSKCGTCKTFLVYLGRKEISDSD